MNETKTLQFIDPTFWLSCLVPLSGVTPFSVLKLPCTFTLNEHLKYCETHVRDMSCGPIIDILGILLLQLMVTSLIAEFVIE